ncbi:unnamed protein product (macronuclear) [Paramecium tetraurelia]|uniref:Rhomboid-like protease n=1 Tax=Paramecium tetraurelia TaxID=5888 RepID=A0BIU2_PARTE|nr:uncharacterized protein GSPATT00004831001 [Paramecium tetraurelia]CAK58459.1 unnamed protein product [Paramecium tetraurelia]|eukprot:XP_001425857.1 hypothetical protein (macronuclear) [Paramecium tetraurelia strain d4-2]
MYRARRHPDLDNMPEFLFENTLILSDPREENCYSTIKDYCCPNFTLMSFTAIVSLIQLSLFIVMCFFGDFNLQNTILQFSDETLDSFGRCSAYNVKYQLEFYRLLTCLFIFNNVKDLCGELLLQVIVVSMAEKFIDKKTTLCLYLLTGVAGSITFIVFYDQSIQGNSFCVFGMVGLMFGFIIQNAQQDEARQVIMQVTMFIFIIGLIGFFYKNSLIFGIYGSFLIGIIIGLIQPTQNRIFQRTKLKFVGLGVIFMYFTGFIYIFFSFRIPSRPIQQQ